MNKRISFWTVFAGLLLSAAAVVACGGSDSSNAQPTNTAARRTAASTRASTREATANVAPTQDALDDSGDNADSEPRPTQDVLDDSGGSVPSAPKTQNGQVILPDTAWMVRSGEQVYRFCQNNAWEIVQSGDTVAQQGTFKTNGAALALTNSANQQVTEYQMQWDADARTLKLTRGDKTLLLEYDGKANCSP